MNKTTKTIVVTVSLLLALSGCAKNDATLATQATSSNSSNTYVANPNTNPISKAPVKDSIGSTGMGNGIINSAPPVDPATVTTHTLDLPTTETLKVKAGDKIDVNMYNQEKNTSYSVDLYFGGETVDSKKHLDNFNSNEEGNISGTVTIPDNFGKGIYTLTLTLDKNIFAGNIEVQ